MVCSNYATIAGHGKTFCSAQANNFCNYSTPTYIAIAVATDLHWPSLFTGQRYLSLITMCDILHRTGGGNY